MIIFTMMIKISNRFWLILIALNDTYKKIIVHKISPHKRQIENLDGIVLHKLHF